LDAAQRDRDARPTQQALDAAQRERDARPTQQALDAAQRDRDARPTQQALDAAQAERDRLNIVQQRLSGQYNQSRTVSQIALDNMTRARDELQQRFNAANVALAAAQRVIAAAQAERDARPTQQALDAAQRDLAAARANVATLTAERDAAIQNERARIIQAAWRKYQTPKSPPSGYALGTSNSSTREKIKKLKLKNRGLSLINRALVNVNTNLTVNNLFAIKTIADLRTQLADLQNRFDDLQVQFDDARDEIDNMLHPMINGLQEELKSAKILIKRQQDIIDASQMEVSPDEYIRKEPTNVDRIRDLDIRPDDDGRIKLRIVSKMYKKDNMPKLDHNELFYVPSDNIMRHEYGSKEQTIQIKLTNLKPGSYFNKNGKVVIN
jgi:hypothetical protein